MAFDPSTAQEFKLEIPKGVLRFGGRSGSEERFRMLSPQVQEQLISAAQEYHSQTGRPLQINSAYRTIEDQQRLYDESVRAGRPGVGPTGMPIAKPGQSKHNKGIVVDIQQGKDDPVAQQILSQRGFAQNVAGDPVHFEFVEKKAPTTAPAAPAAPTIRFDPTSAKEFVEPTTPQPPKQPVSVGRAAQAGLAGITQGALAGLGQYPAAGMLSLASMIAPQGERSLSYPEALAQVRESQQSLREEAPLTYGAGTLAGGVAGFGKILGAIGAGAKAIPGAAGMAGLLGYTSEYTRAPETTPTEAGIAGGVSGLATAVLGGAGKGVETGLKKYGEKTIQKRVESLVESKTPEAEKQLVRTFGVPYQQAVEIAKSKMPTMDSVRQSFIDRGKQPKASDVINTYNKKLAQWRKENANLKDIRTFVEKRAEDPSLISKYTSDAEKTSSFAQGMREAGARLESLERGSLVNQLIGQGIMGLAAPAGLGALGGAAYGMLTEKDPLAYAIGGAGALPTALSAARYGGARQFLYPTQIGTYGGEALGSQAYRLGDMFRRE